MARTLQKNQYKGKTLNSRKDSIDPFTSYFRKLAYRMIAVIMNKTQKMETMAKIQREILYTRNISVAPCWERVIVNMDSWAGVFIPEK